MKELSKIIVKTIKGTCFTYDWDAVDVIEKGEKISIVDYETKQALLIVPVKNLEYVECK